MEANNFAITCINDASVRKANMKRVAEIEKYAAEKFSGKKFPALTLEEKRVVYREIVKSSGRSSPKFNSSVPKLRLMGSAFIFATVAISGYNIWKAENRIKAGIKEGLVFGGGFLGSASAGAIAGAETGLTCGPAAPYCTAAFFIVGGIIGAFVADHCTDTYDMQLEEMALWLDGSKSAP